MKHVRDTSARVANHFDGTKDTFVFCVYTCAVRLKLPSHLKTPLLKLFIKCQIPMHIDLWWKNGHWDRFFPEYFGFPLSISFCRCSITCKRTKNNHHLHLHHRVAQEALRLAYICRRLLRGPSPKKKNSRFSMFVNRCDRDFDFCSSPVLMPFF
jgi:hypothetical protein